MKKLNGLISLSETTTEIITDEYKTPLFAPESAVPLLATVRSKEKRLVLVTHSSKRASDVARELSLFTDGVLEFPAWETLPHERLSPNSDTVARRIDALYRLSDSKIIVAPVRAFVQPIIASITTTARISLSRGITYEFSTLISDLSNRGYQRVDLVERRGDFAVRGGIIDVFPPLAEHPIRIEFFGDEIEELKYFEISDQRTFLPVTSELTLLPCKELLITSSVRERARELGKEYLEIREMCEKISDGIYVEGMESISALLGEKMVTLVELIDEDSEVIILEEERVRNRTLDLIRTSEEFFEAAWSNLAHGETSKSVPLSNALHNGGYVALDQLAESAGQRGISWRAIDSYPGEESFEITQFTISPTYRGDMDRLIRDLRSWLDTHHLIELIERSVGGVQREYLVIEYAPSKRGHPADRIFVPTDALELVTRYVGGETPALHKIGGGEWIKAKSRAKKAVKEIAGELIRLYAARKSSPGYAFSPDTTWQRELEDSFSFVETPDQLTTINEVKADMEQPFPMDRVVCGDVGYGKTEIAVRAAFKAVQDGKQVAVLVPTTLLVQQHFATFSQRYLGFPVKVSALSRFNTTKEINETLNGLSTGSIDVVIGTHRLLSDDIRFRDLGLIVVDEEQRFGVEHKEKLKKLRTTVDVLSMSATPIPRTLEMAITGIREMSTIATPPEERHPVLTYVGAYEEKQIAAAIHRELLRDGQVFYIHNRVESIDEAAIRLKKLIPEARVAVAHGQMNETALEQVVVAFWNREFDILVCTTIVENG
ncbi:MAG: DEAD/DEAH box helicase, partial [Actinobacteria bacterium]|nr:DEAD/DEAH box helicase [Actinomycetota bacterium]